MRALAIATDINGNLKMVFSQDGRVLIDDGARLPRNPTMQNFASALRLLADRLSRTNIDLPRDDQE